MDRVQSEPQLPPNLDLRPDPSYTSQVPQNEHREPVSEAEILVKNPNHRKILTSRTSNMFVRSSQREVSDPIQDQLRNSKQLITPEDMDRIALCKETIAKAKDFRARAQQMNVSVPIVTQKELTRSIQSQSQNESGKLDPEQPQEIDYLIQAINEIMHADQINKHTVEQAQIERITRLINSSKGEQCRDVLRYISNLKKQFNECLGQLESLTSLSNTRFAKVRDVQIQQNNALSAEVVKVQKLQIALRSRDIENQSLKQQLQDLLQTLKERDNLKGNSQELKSEVASSEASVFKIDDKRDYEIMSLSSRLEQELSSHKALNILDLLKNEISSLIQEKTKLNIKNQQMDMKYEAQSRNLAYLEEKLAAALTEREEQVVELKSKIVIYKSKAKNYKQKLNNELEEFKKQSLQNDQDNCFRDMQMIELELAQLKALISERDAEIKEYEQQADRHKYRIQEIQKQFTEQLEARELKYQTVKDQLQQLEREHTIKLKYQVDRTQSERRALDRFEQEQTLKELRLEYLESNQKKMQQQKDFLEKQVAKDIREMSQQMLKTKVEIKKDQLISSQSALSRLEQMYAMMQQSLRHVTRVVSFMTFDVENTHTNLGDITDEENQLQKELVNETNAAPSGVNLFNDQKHILLSTEQLLSKHPFELMESIAQWLYDLLQNSNGPPIDDLEQLINILKAQNSSTKVEEISRNFLLPNRLHYEQYVFRLNEKSQALQTERDRLQKKIQEMHVEMEEILQEYGNESGVDQARVSGVSQIQVQAQDGQDVIPENQVKQKTAKRGGKDLSQRLQLKEVVTKRLNEALTERVRDIKLILNRKYFELQDKMKLQKDKYELEIQQLKVQYGKDLNQVHMDCKKALVLQRKEIDEQHKIDFKRMKSQFTDQFKKLKTDFEEALKKLNREKMQERYQKQSYQSELLKQKQESCGLYSGGFGTFTIAFENPIHAKLIKCQQQIIEHQNDLELLKSSLQGAKAKVKHTMLQAHAEKEKQLQDEYRQLTIQKEQIEILPIDKLNHFIEVGFQISSRNYQALLQYNEVSYESMTKKYVFEFQNQLDRSKDDDDMEEAIGLPKEDKEESRLLQKENMLRQQISDNFALFNEINPIYISLNLGRPVSPFPDVSLPIENFRLAHRISENVSGQYLTINFLKTDQPFTQLRIIAFNNQTCETYQLDLTKDDLLVFVEGNLQFLEEENCQDLYKLLSNSFTIITRKQTSRGNVLTTQVLTVEHRCFFNELYRNHWDSRNKKIKARHNKITQGLIKEIGCMTNFDQSILYEGFEQVFNTEICLEVGNQIADHFQVTLQRGIYSAHLKLVVKLLYSDLQQTLCLMKSHSDEVEGKSQNLAAALMQKPDVGDKSQALAYIISMEKIFGTPNEENVIVKITSLQKRDAERMNNFKWNGEGPPNLSSTKSVTEIIYLTKMVGTPNVFCQVKEFDILNTEVRAQLFSHTFGYKQVYAEFGDIAIQNEQQQDTFEDQIDCVDLSLDQESIRDSNLSIKNQKQKVGLTLPPMVNQDKSINKLILRHFTIVRVKSIDDNDEEQMESQYTNIAFYSNARLIDLQCLYLEIEIPELDIKFSQEISPMTLLSKQQYDEFTSNVDIENHAKLIIDSLILADQENKFVAELDPKVEPFSVLMQQMKQQQFDETIAKIGLVQFQLEFQNPKALGVTKSDLVDCKKTHTIAILGQRPFKITCYFLSQLRNQKVKQRNVFDFDCIFVQAFSITLDKTFELVLTEHDIGTLVQMLQEATQHKTAVEYLINYKKLFNSQLSHKQLMSFVIEVLQFDPTTQQIYASFEQLLQKMIERRRTEIEFMEVGGHFVKQEPQIKQMDHKNPELTKTLISQIEKDLSNSKIYIKVYRLTLQSLPGLTKLQLEIYDVEEPSIVFKIDYLTSQDGIGKQVLFERFSLADEAFAQHNKEQNLEYNDNGQNRGLIFSISETAFPHEINLMLLEPCSHIFWYQTIKDDKINMIERRSDRQIFAQNLEQSLQQEIFRDISQQTCREVSNGYQKLGQDAKLSDKGQIEILKCDLKSLGAKKVGDLDLVYGKTIQFPQIDGFVEIRLYFSHQSQKLSLEWFEKQKDDKILFSSTWQISLNSQAESSRYYQGSMRSSDGSRLICSIEQASAARSVDNCLRIQFKRILSQDKLENIFDLVIVDPRLLKQDNTIREDIKFQLGMGYRDTYSSILKIDDISVDIALSKVQLPPAPPKVQPKKEFWNQIYRRVLKQNDANYIISAMQHNSGNMLKLNVFESNTQQQQIFVFEKADVLSQEEIQDIHKQPDTLNKYIKLAVDTRLKIRELNLDEGQNQLSLEPSSNHNGCTFSASFLNPSVIKNLTQSQVALNQLFPGIEEFDIRNECTNSLFQPTELFETPAKPAKYTLLAQFTRDEYVYDVHQVLDPYQLILKVQVYNVNTFELVANTICNEAEIRKELSIDKMTHLMEGHLREQLAQYLIQNSYMDEQRKLMLFQKSSVARN